MKFPMRSAIFAVLLGAACAASAQMYRWTDDKGRVHITDTPPPPGAKAVKRSSFSGGNAAAEGEDLPFAVRAPAKNSPVTLYTAPECESCGAARALLNARGVPFREVSVIDEVQAQALKQASGGLSVPTIAVGGSVQRGFEAGAYQSLLDIAGYPPAGAVPPRKQAAPKPPPAEGGAPAAEEPSVPATGPYAPR
jgi:glutaredoxin